jgi:3-oxoacyl-[acyl-carrier-protein] synthase-1
MKYSSYVRMTPSRVVLNEKMLTFEDSGKNLLLEIYRKAVGDWPKFFKMDPLSKVGFVSTELLLSTESPRVKDCEDRAVILFNRSGSLADDRIYEGTISCVKCFVSQWEKSWSRSHYWTWRRLG